jgi:hypothetical protein
VTVDAADTEGQYHEAEGAYLGAIRRQDREGLIAGSLAARDAAEAWERVISASIGHLRSRVRADDPTLIRMQCDQSRVRQLRELWDEIALAHGAA